MMMTKQIAKATQATNDSKAIKKHAGRRPTYVVRLSDEDKGSLSLVIAKRGAQLLKSPVKDSLIGQRACQALRQTLINWMF